METNMSNTAKIIIISIMVIFATVIITKEIEKLGINKVPDKTYQYKQALINTDKEFNIAAAVNGRGKAFIDFADNDVILLRQEQFPIFGKYNLAKHYLNRENVKTPLTWEPLKAEVSLDGSLGFTFGKWEYTAVDKNGKKSTSYGNYVTIWKKQNNGTWKYVLDGGGTTPGPVSID